MNKLAGLIAVLLLAGLGARAADWQPDAGAIPGRPKGQAAPPPEQRRGFDPDQDFSSAIALATADKPDKTQVWSEDEGNKGFSADALAKVRIMSNMQNGMRHFLVLYHPSLRVKDDRFEFVAITRDVRLLHIRGAGKYVAMDYSTNAQYYDVPNFANYVGHVYDSSLSYQPAGSFSTSNGQMQSVMSVDIMEDVLVRHLGVNKNDPMLATLRARVVKNAKDSGYVLNGDAHTVYLGFGETGMTIWPKEIKVGDH